MAIRWNGFGARRRPHRDRQRHETDRNDESVADAATRIQKLHEHECGYEQHENADMNRNEEQSAHSLSSSSRGLKRTICLRQAAARSTSPKLAYNCMSRTNRQRQRTPLSSAVGIRLATS